MTTVIANKDEAEKCVEFAQAELATGNLEKAEKLLLKSERMYPTDAAKGLLARVREAIEASKSSRKRSLRDRTPRESKYPKTSPQKKAYSPKQLEVVQRIITCTDYYEILEVSEQATVSDINKAYRKLSRKVHPDKNYAPESEDAFKKILAAKDFLIDADQRKSYDRKRGKNARQSQTASGNNAGPRQTSSGNHARSGQDSSGYHTGPRPEHSGNNARPRQASSGNNAGPRQTSSGNHARSGQDSNGYHTGPRQEPSGNNARSRQEPSGNNTRPKQESGGNNARPKQESTGNNDRTRQENSSSNARSKQNSRGNKANGCPGKDPRSRQESGRKNQSSYGDPASSNRHFSGNDSSSNQAFNGNNTRSNRHHNKNAQTGQNFGANNAGTGQRFSGNDAGAGQRFNSNDADASFTSNNGSSVNGLGSQFANSRSISGEELFIIGSLGVLCLGFSLLVGISRHIHRNNE